MSSRPAIVIEPELRNTGSLFGSCPLPILDHEEIVLGHGSGGKLTHKLIERLILPTFKNELLEPLHDGAIFSLGGSQIAFSTDSFVVNPIFFPGGDIGKLAVCGTVNDLAMCGARPLYLSAGLIFEEGVKIEGVQRILQSMRAAADEAGVMLVTGDTKVVDRGKADKVYINTSGIGIVEPGVRINPARAQIHDKILINGKIAQHGMAIMSVREGLNFETEIVSDCASLNGLVADMLKACPDIHVLRDPTRGGVTAVLNEIAGQARVGIRIHEAAVPIEEAVKGACEILGLDPLHVANEGKVIAIVPEADAENVLRVMQLHPFGRDAAIIGEVGGENPGMVTMRTRVGGVRLLDMLSGEQLPRIC